MSHKDERHDMRHQVQDAPLVLVWMTTWYMPWLVYKSIWPQRWNPGIVHAPPVRFVVPACLCMVLAITRPLFAWVLVLEGHFVITVHATDLLARYSKWNQAHFKTMYRYRQCLRVQRQVGLSIVSLVASLSVAITGPWLALTVVSATLLHRQYRNHHSMDYFHLFRCLVARSRGTLVLLVVAVALTKANAWQYSPAFHIDGILDTLLVQLNAFYLLRGTTTLVRYGGMSRRRLRASSKVPPMPRRKSLEMWSAFLDSPDGYAAFRSYCYLELRLEDVLALRLCQEFRRGPLHSLFAAQHVYQQCISSGGPLSTPVAAAWRPALRMRLNKVAPLELDAALFDPMAHDLLCALYTQVFPRFCRHPFGRSWKWFAMRFFKEKKKKQPKANGRLKATYLVRGSIDESNEPTTTDSTQSST
ncbi:hypothetical protein DYB35_001385 [Aphanomyces astaci]|uniref:RGS domain-containing protein n=1 Tax=Aphanomyces astaci TaxID=112090 RepID=A0A3R6XWV5_APHAT|nr:hypothetical protein DYB35_001385 [Aphanomyces astaci]